MVHSVRGYRVIIEACRLARKKGYELQDGILAVGNHGKVGPHRTVQEIPLNGPEDRLDAEEIDTTPPVADDDIVGKKRDSPDVIEMGMGDEDVFYLKLPLLIEDVCETSSVE